MKKHHQLNGEHNEHDNCHCKPTVAVQSFDELEFERGIWTAAIDGDTNKLNEFIRRGDTNRCDNSGYTALHYAVRHKNNYDACRLLLLAGADVNVRTNSGGATPLHRAAMMGNIEIVKLLLENPKINICEQDDDGNTALHRAAINGHLKIIELLIEKSTNIKIIKNKKGNTAYDIVITMTSTTENDIIKSILQI